MFDFDLQLRLWRSVTDAMLHSTQASIAAASAWQDQVLAAGHKPKAAAPIPSPLNGFGLWPWASAAQPMPAAFPASMWWLSAWQPPKPSVPAAFSAGNPFYSAMTPWFEMYWRQSMSAWAMPANGWGASRPGALPSGFAPFWPWPMMTWAYMQTPLTAMMMSAGMPFDVASPSAKAGTAAMDAADAARQQIDNVFSAYRSDGGHAAAQMVTLPWTIAASFMDAAASHPKSGRNGRGH